MLVVALGEATCLPVLPLVQDNGSGLTIALLYSSNCCKYPRTTEPIAVFSVFYFSRLGGRRVSIDFRNRGFSIVLFGPHWLKATMACLPLGSTSSVVLFVPHFLSLLFLVKKGRYDTTGCV